MYDFKPEQEGDSQPGAADKDEQREGKQTASPVRQDDTRPADDGKRPASEMEDADGEEGAKKKKKKEDLPKPAPKSGKGGEKVGKTTGKSVVGGKPGKGYGSGNERRSPTGSQGAATPPKSKPASRTTSDDSDGEERREGPKVPPLKIVINAASAEQEQVKGGKGASGARLPYVVASQADTESDEDYLINRATYVLAGNVHSRLSVPTMAPPCSLAAGMKELFVEQEIERYKLRLQHIIEKEKLVLTVEQEILRVHGRAARALANQALPFSACTILRDEEVYNLATPEQEEKDRNVRDRYNGRQFFSWLQDVDDKWEKIKEGMVLRHHNEAESLHAVQKMDWEWKLKEIGACDPRTTPNIDELHVPMVKVIDDFDMPPS
ncbi:Ankyrin repeat domain-containing protein 12 [Amphibalanus amphitrite]|uniref:Ankyrin repeat domain-containing protein 12 n=1 Tax=Amphibalanus amphitrite TaxID=1232801 RepID=A0A6A4XED7_AMPAM|nr:Ankyrin repeat domain-containing protein 12 [Amphibalanus amphitrite]